ncbi:MAG: hypothetical protein AAFX50_11375, partial [Acidobacteriota bacterium]
MPSTDRPPLPPHSAGRRVARGVFVGVLTGAGAGLANLALDAASTAATLGFFIPLEAWHAWSYALCGAALGFVAGAAVGATDGLVDRPAVPRELVFLGLIGAMQVAALIERVRHASVARLPWPVVLAACLVVIAGFVAWIYALRWLVRGRTAWALALGAVTSSVGLAMNRNVVDDVLSREALVADAGIVVAVALVAVAVGRAGPYRAAFAA